MPDDVTAEELMASGLARDFSQAREILTAMEAERRRADLLIFYTDFMIVRNLLEGQIIDERPYRGTTIRRAFIASGALTKMVKKRTMNDPPTNHPAVGALKELVSREGDEAKMVAIITNFWIKNKRGIFLSPYSAAEVHRQGRQTFDEKQNLLRIEFEAISDDFILGMFRAWHQNIGELASLVLYISKSRVVILNS